LMTRHHLQPTKGVAFVSKQYKKKATLPKRGANSIPIPVQARTWRGIRGGFAEFLWKKTSCAGSRGTKSNGGEVSKKKKENPWSTQDRCCELLEKDPIEPSMIGLAG
jgi:hypothetical protein